MGNHPSSKIVVFQNNNSLFVESDVVLIFEWEGFCKVSKVVKVICLSDNDRWKDVGGGCFVNEH